MKAVAISYVIALILGVVVVALVGYWFVAQGGKTVGAGRTAECDSLCMLWRNSGFNAKPAGIDKCSGNLDKLDFCALKLGCLFKDANNLCGTDEIDYGMRTRETGEKRRVCCKS